nr:hypothetical protein Iba_chr12aCG2350 [Ipomoea batatas]
MKSGTTINDGDKWLRQKVKTMMTTTFNISRKPHNKRMRRPFDSLPSMKTNLCTNQKDLDIFLELLEVTHLTTTPESGITFMKTPTLVHGKSQTQLPLRAALYLACSQQPTLKWQKRRARAKQRNRRSICVARL